MIHPKALPPQTCSNLLPPNRNYDYFSGASDFPFPCAVTQFDMRNAWWLAESSLLAYADETFAWEQWAKVSAELQFRLFQGSSTRCYVVSTEQFVIVAFRGTEVLKKGEGTTLPGVLEDWKTEAKIALVNWDTNGAVHQGFAMALDQVWWDKHDRPGLNSYLDSLVAKPAQRSLWFTGHSLGAALATLAASRYGHAAGLYTFGSPHVGDRAFAQSLHIPAYRFVNGGDLVPSFLAAFGPYEHVGVLKYVQTGGSVTDTPGGVGWLGSRIRKLFAGEGHGIAAFADHAPLSYVIQLWNACVHAQNH